MFGNDDDSISSWYRATRTRKITRVVPLAAIVRAIELCPRERKLSDVHRHDSVARQVKRPCFILVCLRRC